MNEMMDYVRQTDLSSDEGVEGLKSYCDIESYLDYVIFMMYSAQEDLGNTKMYRNPNAGGLFRWIAFDMDLAYCLDSDTVSRWLSSKGTVGTITPISNELFYKLMHNASVRDYFLTRFGELLAGPMSSENICSKIEERAELISNEMKKNCARWEWKYSAWQKNVKRLYQYADERTERLIKYAISLFKLSDEQAQQYFGAAMENEQRRHAGDVQSAE